MNDEKAMALLEKIFADETMLNLAISIRDIWFMDSILSLGWRHPDLSLHQKNWIEHLHFQLEHVILLEHPEAKELLKAGWNPDMDQPIDRERTEAINKDIRAMEKKYLRKTGRI